MEASLSAGPFSPTRPVRNGELACASKPCDDGHVVHRCAPSRYGRPAGLLRRNHLFYTPARLFAARVRTAGSAPHTLAPLIRAPAPWGLSPRAPTPSPRSQVPTVPAPALALARPRRHVAAHRARESRPRPWCHPGRGCGEYREEPAAVWQLDGARPSSRDGEVVHAASGGPGLLEGNAMVFLHVYGRAAVGLRLAGEYQRYHPSPNSVLDARLAVYRLEAVCSASHPSGEILVSSVEVQEITS